VTLSLYLKHIVAALITPLTLGLAVFVVAALFRLIKRGRIALWLAVVGATVSYVGALKPVGDALLGPLERQYPPIADDQLPDSVSAIVVLGSGYSPRGNVPVTGALAEDGLVRIVEGVRLTRHFQSAQLIVSGGAPIGLTPSALGYAILAHELGVPDPSIVVLDKARDTDEEAHSISKLLGGIPFVLVTSAYHMPRAMRLIGRLGARAIPVPTGQQTGTESANYLSWLLPSSVGLERTERALHEYLGLAAISLDLN
jgi:uncharacterized SAM-binding protein YcdF (DUF218 family)